MDTYDLPEPALPVTNIRFIFLFPADIPRSLLRYSLAILPVEKEDFFLREVEREAYQEKVQDQGEAAEYNYLVEIFPVINVKGNHEEIGYQIGSKISDRIHKALEFYKILWQKDEEIVLKETQHFKQYGSQTV